MLQVCREEWAERALVPCFVVPTSEHPERDRGGKGGSYHHTVHISKVGSGDLQGGVDRRPREGTRELDAVYSLLVDRGDEMIVFDERSACVVIIGDTQNQHRRSIA